LSFVQGTLGFEIMTRLQVTECKDGAVQHTNRQDGPGIMQTKRSTNRIEYSLLFNIIMYWQMDSDW